MPQTVKPPLHWRVKPYAHLMRIGDLANRATLTVKTLRFYEQAGVLPAAARLPSGYRDYNDTALARLRFVKAAQTAGLTLAEIRQVIAVRDNDGPPCQHVIGLLNAHAADLEQRIAQLTMLRDDITHLQDRASTLDPATCDPAAVCHIIPT